MTYRELVDKKVTIVFGDGIHALTCDVRHDGDELLTVTLLPQPMEGGGKALVNKAQIRYVKIIGLAEEL